MFGSAWRVDACTLCVNGSEDQFFGRRSSVSAAILQRAKEQEERDEAEANDNAQKNMETWRRGERPNITGDAGQRMSELGMTRAFVAQMEGARHAMCDTHDLALYRLLAEFLAKPEEVRVHRGAVGRGWADEGVRPVASEDRQGQVRVRRHGVVGRGGVAKEREEGGIEVGEEANRKAVSPSASSFLDLTSSFASLVTAGQNDAAELAGHGRLPGGSRGGRRSPRRP